MNLGIIGGGFSLSLPFAEHPECNVVAVAEQNEERLAALQARFDCKIAYRSLNDLLEDRDIGAVAIFTPPPFHARHSITAMRAGKHVLCAVPAAVTVEECGELIRTRRETGQTYMMAETSYYRRETILARDWYNEGRFGELFYVEGEYWHEGLESLMFANGEPTWRHGLPPMSYPTHSIGFLIGVTGERMAKVTCAGWGDDSPILEKNAYANPFWNEIAMFRTDRGHASRMTVGWRLAYPGVERATWYGSERSLVMPTGCGQTAVYVEGERVHPLEVPNFHERLPAPLRQDSGHGGSHPFLVHEFVSAVVEGRRPAIEEFEAVAYTVPGIVAHQSALSGGAYLDVPDFGSANT